jgi:hypothetical protein
MPWMIAMLFALFCETGWGETPDTKLTLAVEPGVVYLERTPGGQDVSVDLVISNHDAVALDVDRLELTVFDAAGHVLLRRLVDGNGVHPGTAVLSARRVEANQTITVFHPFPPFPAELPVSQLRYTLDLSGPDGEPQVSRSIVVPVTHYRNGGSFLLPLRGRFINYDGHDALGHHRRFDVHFPPIAAFGFTRNFMRYSYDFVPVDDKGNMHSGDADNNASWFGFGKAIHAVADGMVVRASGNAPDDRTFDQAKIPEDPMVLFGNVVVVDHGHGEFGVYAHARQGSLRVKVGQAVRRGEVIAQIGASGSAFFPHLHFELQDRPDTRAEGLPSYFDDFFRIAGKLRIPRHQATVDTGEIVEAL